MPKYSIDDNATSNTVVNTEDTFVEIDGFAKLKKVTVRLGDGEDVSGLDNNFKVRVVTKSVLGATGAAAVEVPAEHADDRVAGIAALVKNGTVAFTVGTVADELDVGVVNARETYKFEPENGYVTTRDLADGRALAVLIQNPVVSTKFQVHVEYEE